MTSTTQDTTTSTWTIDPSHTTVEFSAKHMMITTVKGRLPAVTGTVVLDEADPSRSTVEVEFDATSVDTRAAQRDEHLRSAEFLDVAQFPTIGFKSLRLEGAKLEAGAEFTLVGALTIRDVTKEIPLKVTVEGRGQDPWGGERYSFSATGKLDRTDFGLTWNAALETGGVLVSNEIKVAIDVQVVKQ